MQNPGFEDKFLARLDKLDPELIQAYLERLLEQRQFLQTIFDHLDEGVVVTDPWLHLLFANRRARSLLGFGRARNIEGIALAESLADDHPLKETLQTLRDHPHSITGHEYLHGERMLSLSTLPMRMPDGDPSQPGELVILLLHDVTERHRRQEEQARARRLMSLATLTAGIAHEIKNPLNSLNIHAQLLGQEAQRARREQRSPDLERTARAAEVILEESGRLRQIVDDFLQAARPHMPHFAQHELRPLIESLERIFLPECERAGIEFSVRVDPDIPPLMIDDNLLLQALRNLLRNAIDALQERAKAVSDNGEIYTPRLVLDARVAGDKVEIAVSDNGTGIAEDIIEHIFEPYYTTKFSGTGLGLMVVYRIVTEHRGSLHVETHPGEGATFRIRLPLHVRPVRLLGHETTDLPPVIIQDRGTVTDTAAVEQPA